MSEHRFETWNRAFGKGHQQFSLQNGFSIFSIVFRRRTFSRGAHHHQLRGDVVFNYLLAMTNHYGLLVLAFVLAFVLLWRQGGSISSTNGAANCAAGGFCIVAGAEGGSISSTNCAAGGFCVGGGVDGVRLFCSFSIFLSKPMRLSSSRGIGCFISGYLANISFSSFPASLYLLDLSCAAL